jgi:hypothetical protein
MDTYMLDKIEEAIEKFIEATGERPKYLYLHPDTLEELQKILKEKCSLVDFANCTSYRGLLLKVLVETPIGVFYLTSEEFPQKDIDIMKKVLYDE